MLTVDYTRRAETIVDREEAAARRARLHAAETAHAEAWGNLKEVERRKAAKLAPRLAMKARLERLLEAVKARIDREDQKILDLTIEFDREWEDADDAVMAAHDAWTEELQK